MITRKSKVLTYLGILFIPFLIFSQTAFAASQGTVVATSLNVREAASISSKVIGHVHKGNTFDIIQSKNNWDQIKLLNNKVGWVYHVYLAPAKNIEATVTANVLNVREQPSVTSKIVGRLKSGTKIVIQLEQGGWAKMVTPSGAEGWVNESYVTKMVEQPKSSVVQSKSSMVQPKPILEQPKPSEVQPKSQAPAVVQPKTGEKQPKLSLEQPKPSAVKPKSKAPAVVQPKSGGKQPKPSAVQPKSGAVQPKTQAPVKVQPNPAQIQPNPAQIQPNPSIEQPNPSQELNDPTLSAEQIPGDQGLLKGRTIVLDPGHGGLDPGTKSLLGTPEKTLTLETAKAVEQKLKSAGANVIMTRTDDTYISLPQRAGIAGHNHADAFISFHFNWSNDPTVNGVDAFYYQTSKDSKLAADLLNEIIKATNLKSSGTSFNNLSVLRNNSQPCTLIELGFVSNKEEDTIVESAKYRDNVAQGIYQGLLDYFTGP